MELTYFLGANSSSGFYSLYNEFCRDKGDYLHIIKGGPGTGKSGFMRRIAQKAQSLELDVEHVLCSGDPGSLDGIYIPALRQGWADGTAPHAMEPKRFGLDSDYINLGIYCRTPLPQNTRDKVEHLYEAYKAKYAQAYSYLGAASLIKRQRRRKANPDQLERISKHMKQLIEEAAELHPAPPAKKPVTYRRFFHALSCQGEIYLNKSCLTLCNQYYVISSMYPDISTLLERAADTAAKMGYDCLLCPDPFEPEKPEALLLPQLKTGFISPGYELPCKGCICVDGFIPESDEAELIAQHRKNTSDESSLISSALDMLREAKSLHDELEEHYKTQMDFAALDSFTESCIERIFQ